MLSHTAYSCGTRTTLRAKRLPPIMSQATANEPDPDAILAELAAEGHAQKAPHPSDWKEGPSPDRRERPAGASETEVSFAYAADRRRIIAQAGNSTHNSYKDGITRVRYSHADCIDRMIASPSITQLELAMLYDVTPTWMSIVTNCDAFKVAMAERKAELIDPLLLATLNEKYGALAAKSVEVLLDKLNQPADKISDKLALEAAALGAKAMGLGEAKSPAGPSATDHLANLAHRLIDLNRPAPLIVEQTE